MSVVRLPWNERGCQWGVWIISKCAFFFLDPHSWYFVIWWHFRSWSLGGLTARVISTASALRHKSSTTPSPNKIWAFWRSQSVLYMVFYLDSLSWRCHDRWVEEKSRNPHLEWSTLKVGPCHAIFRAFRWPTNARQAPTSITSTPPCTKDCHSIALDMHKTFAKNAVCTEIWPDWFFFYLFFLFCLLILLIPMRRVTLSYSCISVRIYQSRPSPST